MYNIWLDSWPHAVRRYNCLHINFSSDLWICILCVYAFRKLTDRAQHKLHVRYRWTYFVDRCCVYYLPGFNVKYVLALKIEKNMYNMRNLRLELKSCYRERWWGTYVYDLRSVGIRLTKNITHLNYSKWYFNVRLQTASEVESRATLLATHWRVGLSGGKLASPCVVVAVASEPAASNSVVSGSGVYKTSTGN